METNALPNNKLRGALTRGLVALLVAIFLLIATNFAFIDILRGPEKLGPISQEDPGSYVSAEVSLIMDFMPRYTALSGTLLPAGMPSCPMKASYSPFF